MFARMSLFAFVLTAALSTLGCGEEVKKNNPVPDVPPANPEQVQGGVTSEPVKIGK